MRSNTYKPELDGIRALAVIAVIFYHAEITWKGYYFLPGGFLGVDVFFVLSGYLITGILFEKDIKILDFFKSRFDRIYPALILTLFLTCIASYYILPPREMMAYAKSLAASTGFFSNYYFLSEDSYIADSSKYKPLLHTWSLAVEWQFYIILPFLMIFLKKIKNINSIILILSAASFFYCLNLLNQSPTEAFFSSFSRFWEILAGSLTYFISKEIRENKFSDIFSLLGILTIIYCFLFYKDTDKQPGFINLLAVVGTSLIILQTFQNNPAYKLLSSKPFLFFGTISYSLYLLHQPIFAFYRIEYGDFGAGIFISLLSICVIFSYFLYKFYENPLRKSRRIIKYLPIALMILLVISYANGALNTKGYPKRQPPAVRDALENYQTQEYRRLTSEDIGEGFYKNSRKECIHRTPSSACKFGAKDYVITVGDSFAGVFDFSLKNRYEKKGFRALTYEQCPLLDQPIWFGDVPECWEINKQRWEILEKIRNSNIIVGTNFHQFYSGRKSLDTFNPGDANSTETVAADEAFSSFISSMEKLTSLGNRVLILNQVPTPSIEVEKESQRRIKKEIWYFKKEYGAKPEKPINNKISSIFKNNPNIYIIDTESALCTKSDECLQFNNHGGLYNHANHLSYNGVQQIIPIIENIIDQ